MDQLFDAGAPRRATAAAKDCADRGDAPAHAAAFSEVTPWLVLGKCTESLKQLPPGPARPPWSGSLLQEAL